MRSRNTLAALGISCLFVACGDGESADVPQPGDPGVFESDSPGSPGYGGPTGYGGSSGAAGAGSGGTGATNAGGSDPGKTIAEADVIQIENDRLYALSRYSGLTVVDVANPDAMKVLGTLRLEGTPFEMYVKDGVVHAMYSSWPVYGGSGVDASYQQTSGIVTLNAKNPSAIEKLSEFQVPGEISDSRRVDDLLYVVSYENGYCYNCRETESTTVISLDVSKPSQVVKVDELAYSAPNKTYSWGKRSVILNQDRIYIAGREWGGAEGSTIQIVDITDSTGKLAAGASVEAAGMIESRWQLDEKDGYLRVISQPGSWGVGNQPRMNTFKVESAYKVTKVADVAMVLPEPERLRSVRFDGNRAYAITFLQTDPLFVLDFSDPLAPKQLGELEIPGWVYHMEPRGNRLLALGFDQGNSDGSLNVSMFDVADMTKPTMLSRVHFGGNGWGDFAEDQDRIHKAFAIYDALGLIFVPYSGHSYTSDYYCGKWESGVQIVSFDDKGLKKRGSVDALGQARRALLHKSRLLTMSDVSVESFDVTDVDAPKRKDEVRLASIVGKTLVVGQRVVRLSAHYWSAETALDITTLPGAGMAEPLGTVRLDDVFGSEQNCAYGGYYYGSGAYGLHSDGTLLYVLRFGDAPAVAAIDISGDAPQVQSVIKLPAGQGTAGYSDYGYGYGSDVVDTGERWAALGKKLAVFSSEPDGQQVRGFVDVVDFSDAKNPKLHRVTLPPSDGFTSLHTAGSKVVLSRWAPSPTTPGKVRFYAERIETAGSAPSRLSPINVPGAVFDVDDSAKALLTLDFTRIEHKLPYPECVSKYGYGAVVWDEGSYGYAKDDLVKCVQMNRTLKHVSLGSIAVQNSAKAFPTNLLVYDTALGTDRVFAGAYVQTAGNYYSGSGYALVTISGLQTGTIEIAQTELNSKAGYFYASQLLAKGQDLYVVGEYPAQLFHLDASNAAAPKLSPPVDLGNQSVQHVTLHENKALCSHGEYGASWVALP
ncbi:MAG: beta-propeller domain-containing protein [Polyangiaceae bacterium]